jgi:uncharacterized protein YqjF (DUF2071 family)
MTPKPARFLTAEWRWLAMLNFEVKPMLLLPLVPAGTELDSWQGGTFLSLVAFRFLNTRVAGLAIPFHRNFNEVNLRFYVRRVDGDQVKRGVVFIKEIVPRRAIAWVARTFYNENYVAVPMDHRIDIVEGTVAAEYCWNFSGRVNRVTLRAAGPPAVPASGSQEEFVTEHYWGYATQRDGGTIEYQVEHPQWRVWSASEFSIEADLKTVYGLKLGEIMQQRPVSAFLAEGSAVSVYRGRRIG